MVVNFSPFPRILPHFPQHCEFTFILLPSVRRFHVLEIRSSENTLAPFLSEHFFWENLFLMAFLWGFFFFGYDFSLL